MEIITANSNPKIKNINKLNKNAAFRKEEQVFIVEGSRMFRELPVDRVKQVFVSETAYRKYEAELSVKVCFSRCHRRKPRRDFLLSWIDIITRWMI